jgi:membrane peptidoglycan carboxypeptidase
MVLMDQRTGYVKGLIGGRGEKTASLTLNRATNSTRQPGSTFKILSTYSYALDSGMKTLASTYLDDEITYEDGTPVSNSNNAYTHEMMNIRDAIINSVNTVAVQTITDITPKAAYNQLLKYGFTTLSERNDVYQPLALGGIYNGVTNLELTAAFAAIANEGTYTKPIFYTRIEDQDGNIVINNTPETTRAISRETAALLTNAMEDVVTKGTGQNVRLDCGMPVAGKTGTTTEYRDVWFVGVYPTNQTSRYSAARPTGNTLRRVRLRQRPAADGVSTADTTRRKRKTGTGGTTTGMMRRKRKRPRPLSRSRIIRKTTLTRNITRIRKKMISTMIRTRMMAASRSSPEKEMTAETKTTMRMKVTTDL